MTIENEVVAVNRRFCAAWTALFALSLAGHAAADPVADFFKGKTLSMIVAAPPGGGYDVLARTTARHMARHLPGNPQIVVRNMAGAGSIVASNHLYGAAPRDGTVIGAVQSNSAFEPLFGSKEAAYDPRRFNWLGSPAPEVATLVVWHASRGKTLADARAHELTMGSSGVNSNPSFFARIYNETLGLKLKIINGYPGQTDGLLAMERGEIDGWPAAFWSSLKGGRQAWFTEGKARVLLQMGLDPEPELAGVPFALDVAATPDDRALLTEAAAPLGVGRPFLLPPDVPADRVAAMRKALMAVFSDAEFLAEAKRANIDARSPKTGEQVAAIIERSYKAPPQIMDRLRKLLQ